MATTKFAKLRRAIKERGSVGDMAKHFRKDPEYFYGRLRGEQQFSLKNIYEILRYLEIPPEKFTEYFPENGEETGGKIPGLIPVCSYQAKLLDAYESCPYKDAVETLLGIHGRRD